MNNIAFSDYRIELHNADIDQQQLQQRQEPSAVEDVLTMNSNGTVLWKISGFQAKFRTSLKNSTVFWQ